MDGSAPLAAWVERVVPVAMEGVVDEVERGHLGGGDILSLGIGSTVQFTPHPQPGRGARGADQVDDHSQTHEGLSAPVRADVGEQPVLDLVPLAGAGRK